MLRIIAFWLLSSWCVSGAYAADVPRILVFGDSLSAGYGLPISAAWPSLMAERLKKEGRAEQLINASRSGETTAGGLNRLPALLETHKPKVVVLELGANDGLQGRSLPTMRSNLSRMVELAQANGAKVVLVGMQLPPNFGQNYTQSFARVFKDVAQQYKLSFVPFLLEGFAQRSDMFQTDGLHPIADAQPLIVDTVWPGLRKALGKP